MTTAAALLARKQKLLELQPWTRRAYGNRSTADGNQSSVGPDRKRAERPTSMDRPFLSFVTGDNNSGMMSENIRF